MFITCAQLSDTPHIQHGFFTRRDGKSTGIYDSLNCGFGSGDNIAIVEENRTIVADALGAKTLCTVHQTHSPNVITLTQPWHWKDAQEADALVTSTKGVALGILTADCLPILFADKNQPIIGAAHAGWKGAFTGVIENTLAAMHALGAKTDNITATIGPAIAQSSYEVGAEFLERFILADAANHQYFIPSKREGHFMYNLKSYARDRLVRAGVNSVNIIAHDTCAQEEEFFSFRRSTLRGQSAYGRQISVICLK
jgi:polyphenol oxidase